MNMSPTARTIGLIVAVPVVAVLAVVATALLVSDDSTSAGGDGALTIAGFAYEPETLRVTAGEPFRVTNADDATHTVTAEDESFDTGDIAGGERVELTVNGSGEIPYFCRIHEYMRGTIEVE